ncbi:MAG: cation:proton antiporter [Candidatus Verstraetearchaeota archaeon]|nr:cation:proton antiporter [Candidatus Verstraetearchaeota archaeon]RLE57539.1 MAG: hypothetical protein DRJ30_00275 [Candidatus Verstraetearchaeota archaeon]
MEAFLFTFYTAILIMLLGFFGFLLFRRTNIPDIVFLLLLGFLIGPYLHLVDASSVYSILPYVAPFSLALLLFDSGLRMNIDKILKDGQKSLFVILILFIFNLIFVSFFFKYLIHIRWVLSVIIASAISCSGSVPLMVLIRRLPVKEENTLFLSFELTLTNILSVIVALSAIDYYNFNVPLGSLAILLSSKFSSGIIAGFILGIVWLIIVNLLKREDYLYMLTLAFLVFVYSLTEIIGGSGALASWIFGLTLSNGEKITSFFNIKITFSDILPIEELIKRFNSEILFLIRSFFFVLLGLTYSFNAIVELAFGLMVTGILFLMRFLIISILTFKIGFGGESKVIASAFGRGLTSAVIGVMAFQYGLPYFNVILSIVINVLLFSNLLMALSLSTIREYRVWRLRLEETLKSNP